MKTRTFFLNFLMLFAAFFLFAGQQTVQAQMPLYDADFEPLSFTNGQLKTTNSNGRQQGDVYLYTNVITVEDENGNDVQIDAVVKTLELSSTTQFANGGYDPAYETSIAPRMSNDGNNNWQAPWFITLFSASSNGGAWHALFNFQFIKGGTYVDENNEGEPVIIQNVAINSYDIDGNGQQSGSNQFVEFGGFSSLELTTTSDLTATYNPTTGLTKIRSNTDGNQSNAPGSADGDNYRVRVTYEQMGAFQIAVGADAGGPGYFGLDFSFGPPWGYDVNITGAPSLDLNRWDDGFDYKNTSNAADFSGTPVDFTARGEGTHEGETEANITTDAINNPFQELTIEYAAASLLDEDEEQLLIDGTSVGLDFTGNNNSYASVIVNEITYRVSASDIGSGSRRLVFEPTTGDVDREDLEDLLDALQYNNTASSPTKGQRVFHVSVRQGAFTSNVADFYVNINPPSVLITNPMVRQVVGKEANKSQDQMISR